ncbi:MAG: ribonuclease HII [Euryarchaeota archaeon RBG_16_68_13]|nr:MAG: ribonuclease HII [Euryarchaeota archaeon RBG_16_68_13]
MICGVDEAGRGPVVGPMVVAGVCVESDVPLRALDVRDSKKLSPEKREALAPEIRKVGKNEVLIIPAAEIDRMRAQMTLNEFEARLFATIIERLRPEVAYVDSADVDEFTFRKAVAAHLPFELEIVSKHEADDLFPVVSAASILAKVTRDAEMRRIEEELGAKIGSGYSHDQETIQFLVKWLDEKGTLPPHTRASWDTSKRLLSAAATRKLEEFGGGKP